MTWKTREDIAAGAYQQRIGTVASSFTGLNVSSLATLANLTVSSITGAAGWRGISVLSAATIQTSVQASAAQSGAIIMLQIYNYTFVDSVRGLTVSSVGAGFFNVLAINSLAPNSYMPFAWTIIR